MSKRAAHNDDCAREHAANRVGDLQVGIDHIYCRAHLLFGHDDLEWRRAQGLVADMQTIGERRSLRAFVIGMGFGGALVAMLMRLIDWCL